MEYCPTLHYCTTSLLHYSTTPLLHYSNGSTRSTYIRPLFPVL